MPSDHRKTIDDDGHEIVRDDGTSKHEATPIGSAPGAAESGGDADEYEEWTTAELYERAQEVGIDGRASMSKSELISALRSG